LQHTGRTGDQGVPGWQYADGVDRTAICQWMAWGRAWD